VNARAKFLLIASSCCFALMLPVINAAVAQMSDEDRARRWFMEHDRDHDGYVTLDEVMAYEGKLFETSIRRMAGSNARQLARPRSKVSRVEAACRSSGPRRVAGVLT
jgi:hypothetical protein